jgi:hypothetical protein
MKHSKYKSLGDARNYPEARNEYTQGASGSFHKLFGKTPLRRRLWQSVNLAV